MIVAGIDLGARRAAVVLLSADEIVSAATFTSSAASRQDQLFEIADFCAQATRPADAVYVEEPLVGRGVRASLLIAEAAGAVLAGLRPDAYLVPVGSWKKEVVGSGSATKESVAYWLEKAHPHYSDKCEGDQDLADATCIALYGRRMQAVADALSGGHD